MSGCRGQDSRGGEEGRGAEALASLELGAAACPALVPQAGLSGKSRRAGGMETGPPIQGSSGLDLPVGPQLETASPQLTGSDAGAAGPGTWVPRDGERPIELSLPAKVRGIAVSLFLQNKLEVQLPAPSQDSRSWGFTCCRHGSGGELVLSPASRRGGTKGDPPRLPGSCWDKARAGSGLPSACTNH